MAEAELANWCADPDAEPEEGVDSNTRKVVDIIDAFRLQETSYDKKAFTAYIKEFMKVLHFPSPPHVCASWLCFS